MDKPTPDRAYLARHLSAALVTTLKSLINC